jgi:hypothetical protein
MSAKGHCWGDDNKSDNDFDDFDDDDRENGEGSMLCY